MLLLESLPIVRCLCRFVLAVSHSVAQTSLSTLLLLVLLLKRITFLLAEVSLCANLLECFLSAYLSVSHTAPLSLAAKLTQREATATKLAIHSHYHHHHKLGFTHTPLACERVPAKSPVFSLESVEV